MMQEHQNQMRQAAQGATQGRASTRIAVVTNYDPNTYSAKVLLQPENVETGWLPVTSLWIGNGWGLFCPPTSGDMVEVQFQEDDMSAGFICGRFYNDIERPQNVPSGEFWLRHKSGAFFKLLNNGSATFSDGAGATVTLNGDGSITSAATVWNHTGDVHVSGTVTASTNVVGGGISLNSHVHSGVATGIGNTGGPH